MALPTDTTDPGTQQIPLTNAETQAFGLGLPAQITITQASLLPTLQITNNDNPGTQQVPQTNPADQAFGAGLPRNLNVG